MAAAEAAAGPELGLGHKAKAAAAAFKRPAYWMLLFGWGLASCAGVINAVGFRQWRVFVSHVTGTTTAIGIGAQELHHDGAAGAGPVGASVALLCSFVLGAHYSGMLIDKNVVQFNGKAMYGLALVTEAALLFAAVCASPHLGAACAASAACGVQNAMCTSHFGAVVRTTHVTGTATDIGTALGRLAMLYLRHGCACPHFNVLEQAEIETEVKRLIVLVPMWTCFLFGCVAGAALETALGIHALLVPAMATCVVGVLYIHFRQDMKESLKAWHEYQIAELRRRIQHSSALASLLEDASASPTPGSRPPAAAAQGVAREVEAIRKLTPDEKEETLESLRREAAEVLEALRDMEAAPHVAGGKPSPSGMPR